MSKTYKGETKEQSLHLRKQTNKHTHTPRQSVLSDIKCMIPNRTFRVKILKETPAPHNAAYRGRLEQTEPGLSMEAIAFCCCLVVPPKMWWSSWKIHVLSTETSHKSANSHKNKSMAVSNHTVQQNSCWSHKTPASCSVCSVQRDGLPAKGCTFIDHKEAFAQDVTAAPELDPQPAVRGDYWFRNLVTTKST